ncbi:MAG TPA: hypothetical protein PKX15_02755 [Bacteroidales bacterium]|jgi:prefoldin subunit 5|nr:MAG: hypothetical protein BWY27_00646 [Bacteroidetes bacterium ADurb.Bin234]HOS15924.1 hypothetical protein [Bacteroidales bacterium]
MIKKLLVIPVLGLMFCACGGANESTEATDAQIEAIEESNQNLDNVIQSSEKEIDTLQKEVDQLLNNI